MSSDTINFDQQFAQLTSASPVLQPYDPRLALRVDAILSNKALFDLYGAQFKTASPGAARLLALKSIVALLLGALLKDVGQVHADKQQLQQSMRAVMEEAVQTHQKIVQSYQVREHSLLEQLRQLQQKRRTLQAQAKRLLLSPFD